MLQQNHFPCLRVHSLLICYVAVSSRGISPLHAISSNCILIAIFFYLVDFLLCIFLWFAFVACSSKIILNSFSIGSIPLSISLTDFQVSAFCVLGCFPSCLCVFDVVASKKNSQNMNTRTKNLHRKQMQEQKPVTMHLSRWLLVSYSNACDMKLHFISTISVISVSWKNFFDIFFLSSHFTAL